MNTESKARAAEYAKNYPFIGSDGFYGPISIANIGEFNGRDIINLCIRTEKSKANNASISFPKEWNKTEKFRPGMQVNVVIENGFVAKIYEAKAKAVGSKSTVSAARVNDEVTRAEQELEAENAVEEALEEVDETTGEVLAEAGEQGPF